MKTRCISILALVAAGVTLVVSLSGCASTTQVGFGPVSFGGRTEIHELRVPSCDMSDGEISVTLGPITVCVNGSVPGYDKPRIITIDHVTGLTK